MNLTIGRISRSAGIFFVFIRVKTYIVSLNCMTKYDTVDQICDLVHSKWNESETKSGNVSVFLFAVHRFWDFQLLGLGDWHCHCIWHWHWLWHFFVPWNDLPFTLAMVRSRWPLAALDGLDWQLQKTVDVDLQNIHSRRHG